jgi:ApaG protein
MQETEQIQVTPIEYYTATTEDIQIEVVPSYLADRSSPKDNQYFYGYKIRMTNHSNAGVRVIHRHFKIKDGKGHTQEIQGSGVIGEQPMIRPGTSYEYSSFSPLSTPHGNMRGKYQMMDEFGNRFWVDIPLFFFRPPQGLLQ